MLWQKVEALGEDDESVSKREIQIYETIKNQQLVDKFLPTENDMLVLEGTLINVFETPKGVTKDGKEYGGESKIQVMYENKLANGEIRTEMETLTVADTSYLLNKKTRLCVPVALNVYQERRI